MLIMRGIRTREAAEIWGARYGFPTVYLNKGEEKVYGVRSGNSPVADEQA
jgi:hypothetical protein